MEPERDDESDTDTAEAISVVAHEIRLGVLRALWDAENHSLRFSELRRAVGVRDTGKFNYHLSKLEGQFLVHVDDRYELLYPGHRVIDAIQSGVFEEAVADRSVPLSETCPDCDAQLAFTYEEFLARIRCQECPQTVLGYPFDPGGFAGREGEAVARAFDTRTRRYWLSATEGVCPVCAGPTDGGLVADATTLQALERYEHHYASDQPVLVSVDCDHCSFYSYVPSGILALGHPGVTGRLHDRGVDSRERPLWSFDCLVDADCVNLVATDPREVGVTVTAGDGPNGHVTVDETATVTGVEWG